MPAARGRTTSTRCSWSRRSSAIDQPYTLDQVRFSAPLRDRMPRVDLDVTFETGSWQLSPEQVDRLAAIAEGINRAIQRNPREVFMVEGHTDAVGNDVDNLSLSDRRAESVAVALTEQFQVPAENLVTQGYGEQYLKVPTQGPERANRRVAVRRITPLIDQQAAERRGRAAQSRRRSADSVIPADGPAMGLGRRYAAPRMTRVNMRRPRPLTPPVIGLH